MIGTLVNNKYVQIGLGVAVIIIVLMVFKGRLSKLFGSIKNKVEEQQVRNHSTRDGSKKPSQPDRVLQGISESIYKEMKWVGDGFDDVYAALKPLNGRDIQEVYINFGTPLYSYYGAGNKLLQWFGQAEPLDMIGWFKEEYNTRELKKLAPILERGGFNL
mgnify:CR=1 FL=1